MTTPAEYTYGPVPACPKCDAVSSTCKRPSGHRSKTWHSERVEAFQAWMRQVGAPEGEYRVEGRYAILVTRYPTDEEWTALSVEQQESWWDHVRQPEEFFDPPPAHPPGDYQLAMEV